MTASVRVVTAVVTGFLPCKLLRGNVEGKAEVLSGKAEVGKRKAETEGLKAKVGRRRVGAVG